MFLARHCKALYWHILTGRWGCILKMGLHEKIWKACQECFAQHYTLLHETCDNLQKTCFSSFASSCSQQPSQVLSFWSSHSVGVGTPGLKSKAELCCWHMLTSRFPLRKQKFLLHTVSCEPTWGPTWICLQEVLAARPSCRSLAAWLPSALTQGLAETNSAWQLLWDIVRHCEAMWSYVKLSCRVSWMSDVAFASCSMPLPCRLGLRQTEIPATFGGDLAWWLWWSQYFPSCLRSKTGQVTASWCWETEPASFQSLSVFCRTGPRDRRPVCAFRSKEFHRCPKCRCCGQQFSSS